MFKKLIRAKVLLMGIIHIIVLYRVYFMSLYAGFLNDFGSMTWNFVKMKKYVFLYF